MIPEAAVEAAAKAQYESDGFNLWDKEDMLTRAYYLRKVRIIRKALEAALPYIQAQTLDEAVDAFPLETITAPDNAVVWMHRRAQEIRKGAR